MRAFKNILCVSALAFGIYALVGMPNTANAQVGISIGIGSPGIRPVPYPIVRPVPAPIVYPAPIIRPVPYPVLRPTYPIYPAPVVPVVPIVRDRHDYDVLYRDCAHDPWRVYARYDNLDDAERVARRLQYAGNEAFVKTVHNHR